MTPEQFLNQIRRQEPAPAYLFDGPEPYRRSVCRRALCDAVLGAEGFEQGYVAHDLGEAPLSEVLDDAASLSLFAPRRVLWIAAAEAALPRARAADRSADEPSSNGPQALLAGYLKRPSPGVVAVFDVSRYELEGEDKAKLERVREFYGGIPNVVEFPRFSVGEARKLAGELASERRLHLDREAVETLVDALGADAMRIAAEIEKLSLYAAGGRSVRAEDLAALVPDSSVANIFALVDGWAAATGCRRLKLVRPAGAARRVSAAGAELSGIARPAGSLRAGEGASQSATDPAGAFPAGPARLAVQSRTDSPDGESVLEKTVGGGHRPDLPSRLGAARRAAERPHRYGEVILELAARRWQRPEPSASFD